MVRSKGEDYGLGEEDVGAISDRGEKSEKFDLRICWQYFKGEAVDTDQETENGQVGRFQIGAQLAQVR